MSPKRLTRKEMVQQDRIQQTLTQTSHWAVENRNLLIAASIGIILLVVAVWGGFRYVNAQAEARQKAFAEALEIYHAPVGAEDLTPQDAATQLESTYRFETDQERLERAGEVFSELAAEHRGTDIGDLALYYEALVLRQQGGLQQARDKLLSAVDSIENLKIRVLSRNLLAYLAQSLDEPELAINQLEKIVEEKSPNFPEDMILLRLAETYQAAGQSERAVATLKKLISEFPTSRLAREAQARIDQLEPSPPESES